MAAALAEYEAQLAAVEKALEVATNVGEKTELEALRDSLKELLELSSQTAANTVDDEMQRFMSEIAELDGKDNDQQHVSMDELERQLRDLRPELEAMLGEKCSAPHQHSWGATGYHNAIICGIDDEVHVDETGALDVRMRVLYTNPTHKEMLPCKYYLEGACRFDDERCHYSHGALVSYASLKDYRAPEFARLARNCVVLAKLDDDIWHKGRVLCANFVEQSCRVRLDDKQHKQREKDFKFEDLLPIFHDDDLSSGSESETDASSSAEQDLDEFEAARRARLVEKSLFTLQPTQPLGEWEKHTKGIGSKLMAKMGYIHGTGLGSEGQGIVVPVSAQILPQGRSLDHCMELREAANGNADLFSVEKKLRREQQKQEKLNAKAYEREAQRVDVFSFLNETVFTGAKAKDANAASSSKKTKSLQEHSNKSLNVESVRIADDIRRKEREISKVEESIKRNAKDANMQKVLQAQLSAKSQELSALKKDEKCLSKEQATRKTKGKLAVF